MSTFVHENKRSLWAFDLATGKSVAETAEKFGICRKTLYRQLKRPKFQKLVNQIRDQVLSTASARLSHCTNRAVDTLGSMLDSENPLIRVQASRLVISLGLKMRDAVETNDRLNEVERELEARGMM